MHVARRRAWQAQRAADRDGADVLMSYHRQGAPGRWQTYVLFAPVTERGRAALDGGRRRVEHPHVRATLERLREQDLVVLPED